MIDFVVAVAAVGVDGSLLSYSFGTWRMRLSIDRKLLHHGLQLNNPSVLLIE
jgi:hypothetical protein